MNSGDVGPICDFESCTTLLCHKREYETWLSSYERCTSHEVERGEGHRGAFAVKA
jgi:hypothetical protein